MAGWATPDAVGGRLVLTEERTFQERTSSCAVIFIALIGGGMSLAFTLGAIFIVQSTQGAILGAIATLVFLGMPAAIWYLSTSYTIVCRPDGFAVARTNRRRGNTADEYRWDEVTGTRYREVRRSGRSGGDLDRVTGYFSVDTERGEAFSVSERMRRFGELIETVNEMTPHLPYIWTRQTGGAASIGPVTLGRNAYRQIPRDAAAAPDRGAAT